MDKNILLSIIVPVYNVQDYLGKCLDSILCQITDEIECILIDDGSTDNSGKICDEYNEKYSSIITIHKENGGLSSARNEGLKYAKGKYITFIDSDDRIAENSMQEIIKWSKESETDLCFMQTIKFYPNGETEDLGEKIRRRDFLDKEKEKICKILSKKPKYPGSAWGKLYKRGFLEKDGLVFPNDKRYSEDLGFVRDCIINAKTIEALDVPFYEYRQNRIGSITNIKKEKNFFDLLLFVQETVELVKARGNKEEDEYLLSFAAYEYSILLWMFTRIKFEEEENALSVLKTYRHLLKYNKSIKIRIINYIVKFIGIKNTSKLLNFIKK